MSSQTEAVDPLGTGESVDSLVTAARLGSNIALGRLFELFRVPLLLTAEREMDVRVRHRLGPSDLVQQTFLEAKRDLAQFQGDTEAEFLNWLRALLRTNVLNQMRAHRDTEMRDPNREHGLDRANSNYGLVVGLATSSPTPGEKVSAKEEFEQTQAAIDRLPGHYQAVIRGRLLQDQTFAAIAQELQCTEGAARALFYRALTHLQEEIGALDDSAVGRTI